MSTARDGGRAALTWLGQMGLRIEIGETTLFIDYFASDTAERRFPAPIPAGEVQGVSAFLGTHDHLDHIDHEAWRVWAKTCPGAKFVFPSMHREAVLGRNRAIVRENLAVLDAWVAAEPRLRYQKPRAGTTALVYYEADMDSWEFCTRLYHETGAFVTPGDCFSQPKSFRVGYANDVGTLKAGFAAVSAFLKTLE